MILGSGVGVGGFMGRLLGGTFSLDVGLGRELQGGGHTPSKVDLPAGGLVGILLISR